MGSIDFLSPEQKKQVIKKKVFNPNLWRVFLFEHISTSLKSGRLNLEHSYHYRSSEQYLISLDEWQGESKKLIHQADLEKVLGSTRVIAELRKKAEQNYQKTNQKIESGSNTYFKLKHSQKDTERVSSKGFTINTPKLEEHSDSLASILPAHLCIPIQNIISKACIDSGYISVLEHSDSMRKHRTVSTPDILATIFALGCNIGLSRTSRITGRKEHDLDYIRRWHLSRENLSEANEKVVELIAKLPIANHYLDQDKVYTASDGSKIINRRETFEANYSYKYGGNTKASSMYSHIDNR